MNLLQKLYRSRVKIRKGDTNIINVSVLFAGLCLLLAPHMTIAGIIVSMILGYQFSFTGMDPDFASENLEKMVKSAAQNAKSSVSSVAKSSAAVVLPPRGSPSLTFWILPSPHATPLLPLLLKA